MNKVNVTRLQAAIAASTDFNMCDFPTCNVGQAARLEGKKVRSENAAFTDGYFSELLYDSVDLCKFLGIEPSEANRNSLLIALGPTGKHMGPDLGDVTKDDAVAMLDNLLEYGQPLWPWEVS